jgi:hypothetical protein
MTTSEYGGEYEIDSSDEYGPDDDLHDFQTIDTHLSPLENLRS